MNRISNLHFYNEALKLRETQLSLRAIANQDTPNYKAIGVDFKAQLDSMLSGNTQGLEKSDPRHMNGVKSFGGVDVQYINGGETKADGNSVNVPLETTSAAKERNLYNATLNLSKNNADSIMSAMKLQ